MLSRLKNAIKNKFKDNKKEETQESDNLVKKGLLGIAGGLGSSLLMDALMILIVCVVVVVVVAAPLLVLSEAYDTVKSGIKSALSSVGSFFSSSDDGKSIDDFIKETLANIDFSSNEQLNGVIKDYTEKLSKVYAEYKEKNIELDTSLITATIFYKSTVLEDAVDTNYDEIDFDSIDFDSIEYDDSIDEYDDEDDGYYHNDDDDDVYHRDDEETRVKEDEAEKKEHNALEIAQLSEKFDDVTELAENMVSDNKVDYEKYNNYLINTYLPKRYGNYISSKLDAKRMAKEIFEEAEEIQIVYSNGATVYEECDKVCTTTNECYDLEEFVTRVVDHESGGFTSFTNNYAEEWKAQAVAARTYTLFNTNNCKQPIETGANSIAILDPSSARSQHDKIKEAIQETQGQIMTLNGKTMLGVWDSFYKGNNYHCDDTYCYATYEKTGLTWDGGQQHEIKSYKKWQSNYAGGHGKGLSQYGAAYLADTGMNYKDILKFYYADGMEISTLKTVKTGLIKGITYTSKAPTYESASKFYSNVNYSYYLSTSAMPDPGNYGECPWYAQGRAIEIVANSNMPEDRKNQIINILRNTRPNGGDWYDTLKNTILNSSTDIYAAKPGSIITWDTPALPGHVGIIEDVEYDSSGKAARVLVTESWNGTGNSANSAYSYSWQTIEGIRHYTSHGHAFIGYTYLLD